MNTKMMVGIALIVLGVIAFVYQGITYTTREKAIDIGPIEVTTERKKTIPLPPVVGGIALVGGVMLLALGGKKS